jgi:hypothetical protein
VNILHLHPGPDTGGTSAGAVPALVAAGDEVRVYVKSFHRFEYPRATFWDPAAIDESIDWADVVIVHNDTALWPTVSRGRTKPLLMLHHGSRFRRYAPVIYAEADAMGAMQLVSTVDLLLSVPSGGRAWWIPQALDTERMAAIGAHYAHEPNTPLRIAHAPTNRAVKGTSAIRSAVRGLRGRATLDLIEGKPWSVCLARKAQADLFVDQLNLGYGNNACEAWGMGLPVVSGAPEPILDAMRAEYGGYLPFAPATAKTLPAVLGAMVESADLRAEWAATGMAHIEKFHAPAAFAERAHELYDRAIRQVASPAAAA